MAMGLLPIAIFFVWNKLISSAQADSRRLIHSGSTQGRRSSLFQGRRMSAFEQLRTHAKD
jgi:hypothetical protein